MSEYLHNIMYNMLTLKLQIMKICSVILLVLIVVMIIYFIWLILDEMQRR